MLNYLTRAAVRVALFDLVSALLYTRFPTVSRTGVSTGPGSGLVTTSALFRAGGPW